MRSLYVYVDEEGEVKLMMGTHVDDMMWAGFPETDSIIDKLFGNMELKHVKEGYFRFCGREYEQDADFNIKVTCKDNTEKILPIKIIIGDRRKNDKATAGEISQMRSVVGSLAWIARQCRIEQTYDCS